MATNSSETLQEFLTDADVARSLRVTASVYSLSNETVIRVVQAGLPLLARKAQGDPDLFAAVYAMSVRGPGPTATFYSRLEESRAARMSLREDHNSLSGPVVDTVNREAANQTGVTEEEAARVMAATMPAITLALGKATDGTGEAGVMAWLKGISASSWDDGTRAG